MSKQTFITTFPSIARLLKAFLLTLVAVFAVIPSAYADIIRGCVVDSETKEPLPEASVKMTQKFGENGSMTMMVMADSLGVFHVRAEGKCSIEVSMLGYNDIGIFHHIFDVTEAYYSFKCKRRPSSIDGVRGCSL